MIYLLTFFMFVQFEAHPFWWMLLGLSWLFNLVSEIYK